MSNQKAGTVATLAIILAIASFFATFTGNPIWGLLIPGLSITSALPQNELTHGARLGASFSHFTDSLRYLQQPHEI